MTRAILAALVCATAAHADTRREWHGGPVSSWAEIHAPTAPGAVASVTFHDQPIHAGPDTFVLTWDGVSVTARLEFFGGPDGERLHLSVPDGYSVWPEVLEPGERGTGTAHVYPLGVAS